MNKEARLKEIEKEHVRIAMIDMIPMMMLGLALYARFGGDEEPFLDILNNDIVVNLMFVVSIPVILWSILKVLRLTIERRRLEKQ